MLKKVGRTQPWHFLKPLKTLSQARNTLTLSQFCSSLSGFALVLICDSFPNPQHHYSISSFPQKDNHKVGKAIKMQKEYLRIMQHLGAQKHDTDGFTYELKASLVD